MVPSELFSRRSVRSYRDEAVPEELVRQCLEAAVWAPSAHNAQPWRFVLVAGAARTRLARSMAAAFDEDMRRDGVTDEVRRGRLASSEVTFGSAPVLVIACIEMSGMRVYPDEKRQRAERDLAVQSLACAIQNLLLAAHSAGLGACWYSAPAFCPAIVREALELGRDLEPMVLVTAGYPRDGPPPAPPRKPVDQVVLWR